MLGGGQIPDVPDLEEKDPKQAVSDAKKEAKSVQYGLSVKGAGVRSV